MKKYGLLISALILSTCLVGCNDTLNEIKDAASGIDTQANKAANAISYDAHTIRSHEIQYENKTFTINELFKTILRDVQWEYEKNDQNPILHVKGTWKSPLFEKYIDDFIDQSKLKENGKIYVTLYFEKNKLLKDKTEVHFQFEDKILLDEVGNTILEEVLNEYIHTINN